MNRVTRSPWSRIASAVAACAAAVVVICLGGGAMAGAHEGKAVITVDTTTPGPGRSVAYEIRVVWDNDGHPAKDATVTAAAIASSGAAVGPVLMQGVDDDGRYTGTLSFPSDGEWVVRFTVVAPPGTLEIPQNVTGPATTTTPTQTSVASTVTTATSTRAPTTEPASSDDASGSPAGWLIGVAALVVVAAAVIIDQVLRRRRRAEANADAGDGNSDSGNDRT